MKAQDLAQYIINHTNKGVSNLELQKIMYFVVLKHYKDTGEYLLDKDFEAWQFGAIVYDVYLFYRDYGANSIDKTNENIEIDNSIKQRVDFVLSKLSNYTYWDLVDMLHAKGGAWERTYTAEKKGVIPRELIRSESFIIDQICKEMKRLSVKTLEAFVKANGKNHKPITEIDEKIGADYTRHILKIANKAYKNPIRETLKCVFGSFLSGAWGALKSLSAGLLFFIISPFMLVYSIKGSWLKIKELYLCFKHRKEIKALLEQKEKK